MIQKNRRKPLRGSRKLKFRDLPWMTCFKTIGIVMVCGVLFYQFFTLKHHATIASETLSTNLQLSEKVSKLTIDLSHEKVSLDTTIIAQQEKIVELDAQVNGMSATLKATEIDNSDLLKQLEAARTQNDVLRYKLDTLIGNASRSGSELDPLPMGKSGLTEKDLQKLTAGTALAGIESTLLQIETDYNVNALFALAVAKLETGSGTSFLVKGYNNLFAMRGAGDWFTYATKNDSVIAFGKLMANNYFAKGFNTLEKIGIKYCAGSTEWALKAKYHMLNDMRKLH